jgi:energy-coupling factor transport system substrate-specific component
VNRRWPWAVTLASVVGVAAFCWPLFVAPDSGLAHAQDAPLVFAALLPLLLASVLSQVGDGTLDSRGVAMLGVLSALGAIARPLGAGTAGIELVFFLVILGGRVFGPRFGFVLGSTTLFASALLTGGVGPWLPFQMVAASWMGAGAGVLPRARGRSELVVLAVYGVAAALVYGFLMNLAFWPFTLGLETNLSMDPGAGALANLQRFATFHVATSLGWDVGRAITNVVTITLVGPGVLIALRRATRRSGFDVPERTEVPSWPAGSNP